MTSDASVRARVLASVYRLALEAARRTTGPNAAPDMGRQIEALHRLLKGANGQATPRGRPLSHLGSTDKSVMEGLGYAR